MALVVTFAEIDGDALALVGGKGANLARMARAGFAVPPGFCVTTEAFRAFLVSPGLDPLFAALDELDVDDAAGLREAGSSMREHLLGLPIPSPVEAAIEAAWTELGPEHAYAVRSSATAEDLPSASFAGQQDTYLNVIGRAQLLDRVRACWASLFTDRAISYRARAGFDHRKVLLSVVVQRMARPDSAGVMFTADPVDGRRQLISIDAAFGLGEALVSGQVNPDHYRVDKRGPRILDRQTADKRVAIVAIPASEGGGTERVELDAARREAEVLSDAQILELAGLGVALEDHFGGPQDVEWCFEGDALLVTQTRPITTLFPIPEPSTPDPGLRVFLSFGHAQVMTDALAPFAHGVIRRFFPFGRDARGVSSVMPSAGGRLFIDPSDLLRLPWFARRLPKALTIVDLRTAAALGAVVERAEFRRGARRVSRARIGATVAYLAARVVPRVVWRLCFARTQTVVSRTRELLDAQYAQLERDCAALPDEAARLRASVEVLAQLFERVFLRIVPSVMAAGIGGVLVRKLIGDRVDPDDLEALRRGLRGNITTQMDLELGDLADLARASPELVEHLRTSATLSLEALAELPGAKPLLDGLDRFLAEYGMRGAAEIDVTRPRWRDDPSLLLQVLRGNLSREAQGSHREQHEGMIRAGDAALERIVAAAPWLRRGLVRRFATVHRDLAALREHPKFQIIRHFWVLHRAALDYGARLVEAGELDEAADIWMLEVDEVLAHIDGERVDLRERVAARRLEWSHYAGLAPPRVITSEGEIVRGELGNDAAPPGALIGTGVSAGVVEGLARVVHDPSSAVLHAGEILVAPFTDPGWTPLFINAAGLVMEVGGMMTHGSVVAREYGIPAVVSVDGATTRIRTGQRLVVDGTRGFVTVLEPGSDPESG
ncbi:phosphoenolpyruvate synthase [Enhygromyxa salina]|nr:phosphoenolpyruvate synthase [Enhygromyxa salina]